MLRFILPLGLIAVVLAEPQWGHYGGHSAGAPIGADGRVVDTPEVQQAKAAHLAALADASSRGAPGHGGYGSAPYNEPAAGPYQHGYNGVPAPYAHGAQYGSHYHGPPAPLGPDGRVVDTPEVAAAKAHHFSLYNAASQHAPAQPAAPHYDAHAQGQYDTGAYNPAWDGPAYDGSWNHY